MKVTQSCLTLYDPHDYTVHGILQARILEWVTFPFSRESSQPGDRIQVSALQADSLPSEPPEKPGLGCRFILMTLPSNKHVDAMKMLKWPSLFEV